MIRTIMTVREISDYYQRLRLIRSVDDIVSLVDGYNLPVSITNNVGCGVADCPVDLGPDCKDTIFHTYLSFAILISVIGPSALIGPYDSSGFPVGCKSACEADLDGDPSKALECS